ncbi:hypothetical protein [Dubosiella newyorkensis]|uniref:hypothetical protein n=1 Tax=Dubosiella newyorkensis TaxID=1862672 RepID=UPI003F6695FF
MLEYGDQAVVTLSSYETPIGLSKRMGFLGGSRTIDAYLIMSMSLLNAIKGK